MSSQLGDLGIDTSTAQGTMAMSKKVGSKRGRSPGAEEVNRDAKRGKSNAVRAASIARDRSVMGMKNSKQKSSADQLKKLSQREGNYHSKKGEADRAVLTSRPKHLFSGKRGSGTADHR